LTSPPVLSPKLLHCPIVHEAFQDSRDYFLVVSKPVLHNGESQWFSA